MIPDYPVSLIIYFGVIGDCMDEYSRRIQERLRKADRADNMFAWVCMCSIITVLGLAFYGAYRLIMG